MVRIRFFAAAEDATGVDEVSLAAPTLGQLRTELSDRYPKLAEILPRCAVLVDGARVDDNEALTDQVVVDVLPPFAGG